MTATWYAAVAVRVLVAVPEEVNAALQYRRAGLEWAGMLT